MQTTREHAAGRALSAPTWCLLQAMCSRMGLEKNGTVPQLQLQFKRTLQNINNEQTCVSIVLSRPAFGNPPQDTTAAWLVEQRRRCGYKQISAGDRQGLGAE